MAFTLAVNRTESTGNVTASLVNLNSRTGVSKSYTLVGGEYLDNPGWEVVGYQCDCLSCMPWTDWSCVVALAKFSPITFTKATFTTTGGPMPITDLSPLNRLIMVDNTGWEIAKTSPLIAGKSFTVTFSEAT